MALLSLDVRCVRRRAKACVNVLATHTPRSKERAHSMLTGLVNMLTLECCATLWRGMLGNAVARHASQGGGKACVPRLWHGMLAEPMPWHGRDIACWPRPWHDMTAFACWATLWHGMLAKTVAWLAGQDRHGMLAKVVGWHSGQGRVMACLPT
ncbi:hypothetical protein ACSBR2_003465 [Camellia fascicularis]